MKLTTKAKIKACLEVLVENLVNEYRHYMTPIKGPLKKYLQQRSATGRLKPFHTAIIPTELLRIKEFQRVFNARIDSTFAECARILALDHHSEAKRNYVLTAKVSSAAINEIDRQVSILEHATGVKTQKPSLSTMTRKVLKARKKRDLRTRTSRADLYVKTRDGHELFFQIKSPMPNKGQCLEVTQRLLRFHLLRGQTRRKMSALYAMPYNPYGPARSHYRWIYALNYTPFKDTVVIGQDFWNMVAGPTAYEELIGIYQEVGREKAKYIIDALAFGF